MGAAWGASPLPVGVLCSPGLDSGRVGEGSGAGQGDVPLHLGGRGRSLGCRGCRTDGHPRGPWLGGGGAAPQGWGSWALWGRLCGGSSPGAGTELRAPRCSQPCSDRCHLHPGAPSPAVTGVTTVPPVLACPLPCTDISTRPTWGQGRAEPRRYRGSVLGTQSRGLGSGAVTAGEPPTPPDTSARVPPQSHRVTGSQSVRG